jgi:hypothetical protein
MFETGLVLFQAYNKKGPKLSKIKTDEDRS